MRIAAVFCATVTLSACALFPPSPARLAAEAHSDTTPNLCAATLVLPPAAVEAAQNELLARNATCDWNQARAIAQTYLDRQQIAAQQQANQMAAFGAAGVLLQQSGPHYYAPPPVQTTCIQQGAFLNCTSN